MGYATLRVRQIPGTTMHEIHWNRGGVMPKRLKGAYTTTSRAQQAIDLYDNATEKRRKATK